MLRFSILTLLLFSLSACGGDDDEGETTPKADGGTNVVDTGGSVTLDTGGNNNTCSDNYTTADLQGCFSPDDSGLLEYYCFDGNGRWYHEIWTPISGCGGTLESGNYQVQACTLTVCDNTGCSEYTVTAANGGILVDGDYYSENNGCN